MFEEQIGKWTADHLRTHIEDYLAEVNASASTPITLVVPKAIEVASVVGGLFTEYDNILPQYGIDILGKSFAGMSENLFIYQYDGQINAMVHAGSREAVDMLVKRHAAAIELFIRRHEVVHLYQTNDFSMLDMSFSAKDFSGAEELSEVAGRPLWVAGISINLTWLTSEDGPSQHA